MKILSPIFFFILSNTCFAQFKLKTLDKNAIPKNIQYNGHVIQAVRWTDSTGNNIVLFTRTDITKSKDYDGSDAALYAYHYLVSGDSIKQTWRVYDFIKECPVDMFLYFLDKTFAVTDLNKDGKAEVWMMYKNACQGDASPVAMKIIMYEDNKKFAVRGTTKVKYSATEFMGGEFSFDEAFKMAPIEFRKYAEKIWKQNMVEKWGK